jgi:hypothetical protein
MSGKISTHLSNVLELEYFPRFVVRTKHEIVTRFGLPAQCFYVRACLYGIHGRFRFVEKNAHTLAIRVTFDSEPQRNGIVSRRGNIAIDQDELMYSLTVAPDYSHRCFRQLWDIENLGTEQFQWPCMWCPRRK